MPETVFGVPFHPLIVHATVVLIPLAALAVLLHAFWPVARRRLGIVTPLAAGAALVLTPLTTESGENLQRELPRSELIDRHVELADGLLPWVIGLFVVALALWLLDVRRRRAAESDVSRARWVSIVAGVLALVVVVGVTQQVVRVGHAGSKAAWNGVVSAD